VPQAETPLETLRISLSSTAAKGIHAIQSQQSKKKEKNGSKAGKMLLSPLAYPMGTVKLAASPHPLVTGNYLREVLAMRRQSRSSHPNQNASHGPGDKLGPIICPRDTLKTREAQLSLPAL